MDERRDEIGALEEGALPTDMNAGTHVGFRETLNDDDGDTASKLNLGSHHRQHVHDPAHIDLLQEEYTPEEAARLIGTSLEVVMHAIWGGDLKAQREGKNVVYIQHADLTDWLDRRAAE